MPIKKKTPERKSLHDLMTEAILKEVRGGRVRSKRAMWEAAARALGYKTYLQAVYADQIGRAIRQTTSDVVESQLELVGKVYHVKRTGGGTEEGTRSVAHDHCWSTWKSHANDVICCLPDCTASVRQPDLITPDLSEAQAFESTADALCVRERRGGSAPCGQPEAARVHHDKRLQNWHDYTAGEHPESRNGAMYPRSGSTRMPQPVKRRVS